MTANVELIDRDGNSVKVKGCRDRDEEILAMAHCLKTAEEKNLRKPFHVTTKKIKSSGC